MAQVRNAFKIRAADAPIVETSQFLQLYCPLLLDHLQRDDLFVPKLIIVRGSPGSGKSSLLRLFETDTLLALHARKSLPSDQELVDQLTKLGILSDRGPQVIGIYIQCDSSLRDIANLAPQTSTLNLFNTLLDIRIMASFLRGVERLRAAGCLGITKDYVLKSLTPGDAPPSMFSEDRTIEQMEEFCTKVERDFGKLLNSFPDDPLPKSIQPHARVYSLAYLALQMQPTMLLSQIMPIVMLDDVQELYPDQRKHLKDELIRRASVPRWLAVRTQVLGLEELVSLEGAEEGREYRELPLDEIFQDRPTVFTKFSANVVHRRLQATDSLQQVTINDFKELLRAPEERVPSELAAKAIEAMNRRATDIRVSSLVEKFRQTTERSTTVGTLFSELRNLEKNLILIERKVNRGQASLFPNMDMLETADGKTEEAAQLFITKRLSWPYYFGFDSVTSVASGNVEQLLSTVAVIADRMIYRAELDRDKAITARELEDILRKCADEYYHGLEEKHRRGSAIRQFIDNFGKFCEEVTYRSNAPYPPGPNGFGLTRDELLAAVSVEKNGIDTGVFREVLTSAVAGNVLSVRPTKQGQAGSEKIVFYLNRFLCVKFRLPLNYGSWQHLPIELLTKMMQEPMPLREMVRRKGASNTLFEAGGE
ncbi:MAG: hypothetical protein PHE84_01290 [bacterium]|nr:hypothetical protein [bacterium]